jgi:hypothetical protein
MYASCSTSADVSHQQRILQQLEEKKRARAGGNDTIRGLASSSSATAAWSTPGVHLLFFVLYQGVLLTVSTDTDSAKRARINSSPSDSDSSSDNERKKEKKSKKSKVKHECFHRFLQYLNRKTVDRARKRRSTKRLFLFIAFLFSDLVIGALQDKKSKKGRKDR